MMDIATKIKSVRKVENEMTSSLKVSAKMKCAIQVAAGMICAMEEQLKWNPQWMRIIHDESNNQNKNKNVWWCNNCNESYNLSMMWNERCKESCNQNEINIGKK